MKLSNITDSMLKLMRATDRKALRLQTSDEAMNAFVARSEKELQVQIANLLNQRGIWHYCARMDRKTTAAKGTPDFLACCRGVPIAWEVKFDGGKLSPEQEWTRDKMISNGWEWRLITNLGAARAHLDSIRPIA